METCGEVGKASVCGCSGDFARRLLDLVGSFALLCAVRLAVVEIEGEWQNSWEIFSVSPLTRDVKSDT